MGCYNSFIFNRTSQIYTSNACTFKPRDTIFVCQPKIMNNTTKSKRFCVDALSAYHACSTLC